MSEIEAQKPLEEAGSDSKGEREKSRNVSTLLSSAKLSNNTKRHHSVLITGGGGYLGYHIALALTLQGQDCILYDLRKPLKAWQARDNNANDVQGQKKTMDKRKGKVVFVQGNVCDSQALSQCMGQYQVKAVIHTVSHGMSGTESLPAFDDVTERVNIEGTRAVIRASLENKVQSLVYTSTINVIFNGNEPIFNGKEDTLPYASLDSHKDHYSRTKQITEELILTASGKAYPDGGGQFHTCALRLNGLYGPQEQRHLPRFINMLKASPKMVGYALDTKQDMTYLHNAVQAHVKALNGLQSLTQRQVISGQAYFITDGNPVNNVKFFADALVPAIMGRDATLSEIQIPFFLVLMISYLAIFMSCLFGKAFRLPYFGLTPSEVYKTGVTHYFSIEKAKSHLGYEPQAIDESVWDEIRTSYGLTRPVE